MAVAVANQTHAVEKKAKSKYYVILCRIDYVMISIKYPLVLRNNYVIYLLRFPYNTNGGRRGCCEGRTYSTELMKCCPQDGVKSLDSKCS